MNKPLNCFLSGAIALGIASLCSGTIQVQTVQAQTVRTDASPAIPGADLKLSSQQRKTVEAISDIAFDQLDTILSSGFDPKKIDRTQIEHRADNLQKLLTSFHLDDQQKGSLRTILQKAREQMNRTLEPGN